MEIEAEAKRGGRKEDYRKYMKIPANFWSSDLMACVKGRKTRGNGNFVSFRSTFGKWMTTERNGQCNANRPKPCHWEKFRPQFNRDGSVSFQGWNGKWMCCEDNG